MTRGVLVVGGNFIWGLDPEWEDAWLTAVGSLGDRVILTSSEGNVALDLLVVAYPASAHAALADGAHLRSIFLSPPTIALPVVAACDRVDPELADESLKTHVHAELGGTYQKFHAKRTPDLEIFSSFIENVLRTQLRAIDQLTLEQQDVSPMPNRANGWDPTWDRRLHQ